MDYTLVEKPLRYDFIRPPQNPDAATRFLADNFLPLVDAYWKDQGRDWYGVPNWDLNALEFTRLWMQQTFVLILAYRAERPAGFLLGAKIRPLLYEETVFQIDQWMADSADMRDGLFDYLSSILKFFQVGEVRIPQNVAGGRRVPIQLEGYTEQIWETSRFVLNKE